MFYRSLATNIPLLRSCRIAASSLTKQSLNSTPVGQWPVLPKNEFPDTLLATVGGWRVNASQARC